MNVVIYGTTGMVGQGVLRQCPRAPDRVHAALVAVVPADLTAYADFAALAAEARP